MLDLKLFLFAFLVAEVKCCILQYNERRSDNATHIMWGAFVVFHSQKFRIVQASLGFENLVYI